MDDVRFAEMISKIAHELRSPLTSVKGFSSTLVGRWDRFTDDQKKQFVETILVDAERMGRIVSEVLDLARLEANRLELNRSQVSLREVADRARQTVAELPGAERVEIDIDDDVLAWADVERLQHVVVNLVENAVKFSDNGPIEVVGARGDGSVELRVVDRGVGIAPDALPRVFEGPGPSGGRATPSGTGLGLYLSRRLVEAHGGSISVESAEGKGSTFTVTMPAPREPA